MVWSGREEQRRFGGSVGHLYRGEGRARTATFSLLQGRELPTTVNSPQCLWWEERERESARAREPCPGPGWGGWGGRWPLVGLSPSGARESAGRCAAFCAKESLRTTRGGTPAAPPSHNCLLPPRRPTLSSFLYTLARVRTH